jgi:hypothetical protein
MVNTCAASPRCGKCQQCVEKGASSSSCGGRGTPCRLSAVARLHPSLARVANLRDWMGNVVAHSVDTPRTRQPRPPPASADREQGAHDDAEGAGDDLQQVSLSDVLRSAEAVAGPEGRVSPSAFRGSIFSRWEHLTEAPPALLAQTSLRAMLP